MSGHATAVGAHQCCCCHGLCGDVTVVAVLCCAGQGDRCQTVCIFQTPQQGRQTVFLLCCAGPAERCQSICMLQILPGSSKASPADCPACAAIQQQTGFERFDLLHAVVVANIRRQSHLPMAMRLKWSPTTIKAQLTANVVGVRPAGNLGYKCGCSGLAVASSTRKQPVRPCCSLV